MIYGGSFNPPHRGHEAALRSALEYLKPDRTLVIPASIPPHKALAEGSPFADERLRLTKLAFEDIPGAEITDIELHREGKSYTVDTLRQLGERMPGAELYFLVGTDMLLYMEQWYEFREIFRLCTLAVLIRNAGEESDLISYSEYLKQEYGARISFIPHEPLPMASTDVRELLPKRLGRELLSDEVYDEIIRRRYYAAKPDLVWLREKSEVFLKPSRVPHVRGCAETARELARRFGEDAAEAEEAGILHDITKRLSTAEQLRLCEKYGILIDNSEREEPKLLHARTGAYFARECFGVSDPVFDAIEWHTTGRVGMSRLEMIVYLADFIEPTRTFDGVETVRTLAETDLEKAMIAALTMSLEDVSRRGNVPHIRTKDTLYWLKSRV